MIASFFVSGLPETKGSFVGLGHGRVKADNPREKAWSQMVAWHAKISMRGRELTRDRVFVRAEFVLPAPVGQKNKRDLDKLLRSALDALSGIVYADDEQVDRIVSKKRVGLMHGVKIFVDVAAAGDTVLEQIALERERQDEKWGREVDDERERGEWIRLLREHSDRALRSADALTPHDADAYRNHLVSVAAIAVAAIEAHDRSMVQ